MFFDEIVVCERINDKKYVWTQKERKINVVTLFKKKKWFILFVFIIENYIVWIIYYELITQKIFNDFVKNYVFFLITLALYENKNFVLVFNNVLIYKFVEFQKIYTKIDVKLIFLFFYSFDYNFIKIFFAMLKKWVKRNDHLTKIYDSKFENFERFLHETIFAQIQRDNSNNLFRVASINYQKWWYNL